MEFLNWTAAIIIFCSGALCGVLALVVLDRCMRWVGSHFKDE
jgi:hypothetical protein